MHSANSRGPESDIKLLGGELGDLSSTQQHRLIAAMVVSDFEPKQIIVHEAQTPATDIHVLLSGIARLVGISPSGGRGSLALRARGVLFHICGLHPELKQRFWWEATSRSRVGVLALEHLLAVVSSSNPANTAQVLNELYGRAVGMFGRYPGWSGRNLRRRVGLALLELAEEIGIKEARGHLLGIKIPARVIGEMTGASRPKVNLMLLDFEHRGLIVREQRRVVIATDKLRAFLQLRR